MCEGARNMKVECGMYVEVNVAIECSCIKCVFVLYL
jgi:hypothetical protein